MKQINLIFVGVVVLGAIFFKLATRKTSDADSTTAGAQIVPLEESQNVQITEAAYHQGDAGFAAASGPDENRSGSEVTLLL